MNNLLKLLQKYQLFLVFIFFQVVCFVLIFNQNDFHNSSRINSSNRVIGSVYDSYSNSVAYFNLKAENEKLNAENAKLKSQLKGYKISEYNSFAVVNDSIKKLNYKISPAQIINSFTKGENNYLTLNVGSKNGIEPQMSVLDSKGVIGFTKDVSDHYSTVIPIIHREFLISIIHQKSKSLGLLKWTEDNSQFTATVINLPKYIKIKKGDKIVTKGNDGIFIPGELIGTVQSVFAEDGSDYNSCIIKLSVDYNALMNVYVVKNLYRNEKKNLEDKLEE